MAGHRYTAKDRTVRKRIRGSLVEENLRTGQRRRVGKREVDHAVTQAKKEALSENHTAYFSDKPANRNRLSDRKSSKRYRYGSEQRALEKEQLRKDILEEMENTVADEVDSRHTVSGTDDKSRMKTARLDIERFRERSEPIQDDTDADETLHPNDKPDRPSKKQSQRLHERQRISHDDEKNDGGETDPDIAETVTDEHDSSVDKHTRMRKQAEAFRSAEKETEAVRESFEEIADKEATRDSEVSAAHKKSRLNHGDESSGMIHGVGKVARNGLRAAATVPKHYLRHEMQEADQDNAAIQSVTGSVEAGRKAENILESSKRHSNLHAERINAKKAEAHSKEKAAETEKRKKDEIRSFQKKKRQKAAAAAKRSESVVSAGGFVDSANSAFSVPAKAKKAAQTFFSEHKGTFIGIGVMTLLFMVIAVSISSCAAGIQGSSTAVIETTYSSTDEDIYAAENAYCALEDGLNAQVNAFQQSHPEYDAYEYQIDEIEHNPYSLISYLQVKYGGFVYNEEIKAEINRLFSQQYQFALSETSETRTRIETVIETRTMIDPETGELHVEDVEVEQEVEYEYKTLYVQLTNKNFDMIARNNLTAEQIILFDALNRTYGNRPNLFDLNSIGSGGTAGINYTIPPEALSDEKFRNMIIEAEKYLGYPYVWGGKSPKTSFDCSGFVCWVINHCANNWDIGTIPARYICKKCIYVSPSEARPGDLIFFEKTYEVEGASHVGIYVGDGVMLHCGNPIKYSSINTRYFKEHFLCFGRLPFYDD